MENVLGYIRVSTANQVKEGYSLDEQLDEIETFCTANGYNLVEVYRDEGKSGAKTDEEEEMTIDSNVIKLRVEVFASALN